MAEAGRLLPAVCLLALVAGAVLVLASTGPDQDDAGSGRDAPPVGALGVPVDEVTFTGTLDGSDDLADAYRFDVDERAVLRLETNASDPVRVRLFSPDGDRIACAGNRTSASVSAVTEPQGTWEIVVDEGHCGGLARHAPRDVREPVVPTVDYEVEIDLQRYDRWKRLAPDTDRLHAFNFTPQQDQSAYLEARLDPQETHYEDWHVMLGLRLHVGEEIRTSLFRFGGHSYAAYHRPAAWADGYGGPEVRIDPAPIPPEGELTRLVVEGDGAALKGLDLGFVRNVPLDGEAWIAWNDGPAPGYQQDGGAAEFVQMGDMEPQGPAVQAGTYVKADELRYSFEAGPSLNIVILDAVDPRPGLVPSEPRLTFSDTRFVLEPPNGTELVYQDAWPAFDYAEPGTWNLTAENVDGVWGERAVLVGVRFPFPVPLH